MASPSGEVRDVRERKRRTQTERRGKGMQCRDGAECARKAGRPCERRMRQAGAASRRARKGGRSAPKTRIKNCAGESSVRRR